MNTQLIKSVFVIIFSLLLIGCNSTIYDIEEIEEPTEIKSDLQKAENEIKEDINSEAKLSDNKIKDTKFKDKQFSTFIYTIQIGSFKDENNAIRFTGSARNILNNENVYYNNIEGLYKVRTGVFNNPMDAGNELMRIKNAGYSDSYIIITKD